MDIHKKHKAYTRLKTANKEAIERDIALLKEKAPQSPALSVSDTDLARKGQEVLWELLDVVTVEDIESARDPEAERNAQKQIDFEKLKTDDEALILQDIALLTQKNPESEVLKTDNKNLLEKGEKVLLELLDIASVDLIKSVRVFAGQLANEEMAKTEQVDSDTTNDLSSENQEGSDAEEDDKSDVDKSNDIETPPPAPKKKAKRKNTPTSRGKKTSEPKSKKP